MSRGRRAPTLFEVPEVDAALQDAVEETSRFFVDMRGVGHFPAPSDSRYILTWCQAGAPLPVLLRALHGAFAELTAKGQTLRTLSQLKRRVEGDLAQHGARSLGRSGAQGDGAARGPGAPPGGGDGATPGAEPALPQALVDYLAAQKGLLRTLEADGVADGHAGWITVARQGLAGLGEAAPLASDPEALVPHLMGVGRRFYDGVWDALGDDALAALREDAEAALEGWIRPMSDEVREDTLRQLMVADLRRRLGVLCPEDLFGFWEG